MTTALRIFQVLLGDLFIYKAKVHTVLWKMIVYISPILFVKLRKSQSNTDHFLSGSRVMFSTPHHVYTTLSSSSPFERGQMMISWRRGSSPTKSPTGLFKHDIADVLPSYYSPSAPSDTTSFPFERSNPASAGRRMPLSRA